MGSIYKKLNKKEKHLSWPGLLLNKKEKHLSWPGLLMEEKLQKRLTNL